MNKLPFICFKNGGMSLYWNAFFFNYLQEEPIQGFKVCEYLEFMVLLEQSYRNIVLTAMKNICIPVEWEASCVLIPQLRVFQCFQRAFLRPSFTTGWLNICIDHVFTLIRQFSVTQPADGDVCGMRASPSKTKEQKSGCSFTKQTINMQSVFLRGHVCSATITTHSLARGESTLQMWMTQKYCTNVRHQCF